MDRSYDIDEILEGVRDQLTSDDIASLTAAARKSRRAWGDALDAEAGFQATKRRIIREKLDEMEVVILKTGGA